MKPKCICMGCNVSQEISGENRICKHCTADWKGVRRVLELILKKFPKMASRTTPEIILRLWMSSPLLKDDVVAQQEAEDLYDLLLGRLVSEPVKAEGTSVEGQDAHRAMRREREAELQARSRTKTRRSMKAVKP